MAKVTKRERLLSVCRNITGGGNVDADAVAAFRKAVLRYADLQHITPDNLYQSDGEVGAMVRGAWDVIDASNVLKELDDRQRSSVTGAVYPRSPAFFLDLLTPDLGGDDRERDDDEGDDVEKAKTAKEQPMTSHTEFVRDVVKQYGITALCKSMVQDQKSYGLDESSFTALVVDAAKRDAPAGETEAQSFSRLFTAPTPEGELLRRAHGLAKETTWLDLQPQVISGGDLRDANDADQAMDQLRVIGQRMAPSATPEKQFAVAFAANPSLAARAHRRPSPTTFFPPPR